MKRIFVAIDISPQAKVSVLNYIEDLKKEFSDIKVGWLAAEKLHLTLKFFGDIDNAQIAELKNIIKRIAEKYKSFEMFVTKTGVFPDKRKAKILWLGIAEETNNLKLIKDEIEIECKIHLVEKETRKYKPHLTIGRIREPKKSKKLAEKHLQNDFEPVRFNVSGIIIYESELKPAGSVYSIVAKFSLL